MDIFRSRPYILFIFIVPALVLWRAVFLGEAIGPFDDVRAMMAGHATPRAWDVLQADAVLQFYSWRDLVFESWSRFQVPMWNPYQLMGAPLLANSQSAGFYPLHIVMGVLKVPTALAITILAYLHLVWAGLGIRSLSLKLGACEEGAIAAGILMCASPFMVSWVGLASVITTVCWIPWALRNTLDLASHDPWWKYLFTLAICVGMMILGGHLQFAAYGIIAVALVAVWQTVFLRVQLGSLACIGALAVGCAIAAPQLFPTLVFSRDGHRVGSPSSEGYQAYVSSSVKPFEAQGLMYPSLLGTPGAEIKGLDLPYKVPNYWPGYVKRGANYAESAFYLGPILVLLLCGIRFVRDWRRDSSIVAVGVVGLMLAFGTPLNALLYFYVPGWSSTGSPGRAEVLFVIAACALASLGWPDGKNKRRESFRWWSFFVIAMACLWAHVMSKGVSAYQGEFSELLTLASSQTTVQALPYIALTVLLAVAACMFSWRQRQGFALGLVAPGALFLAGPKLVPTSKEPWQRRTPEPSKRVAFVNEDWSLRIGVPVSMPPNVASAMRINDVAGYDSLLDYDTTRWLDQINGEKKAAPLANGNMMFIKSGADKNLLTQSGVTEIWSLSDYTIGAGGKLVVEKLDGPGRATMDGKPVALTEDGFSRQVVKVTGPGWLVVRDRKMKGWRAELDGEPTYLDGTMWREVSVPKGEHTVVLKYDPPFYGTALWIGLVGFLLAFLALLPGPDYD